MTLQTRSQRFAQAAFERISEYHPPSDKYVTFAKRFPALIHTCGLAQALSFALAKDHGDYVDDLAAVLRMSGGREAKSGLELQQHAVKADLASYLRMSRDAIQAASWLKRYAEAACPEPSDDEEQV